MDTEHKEVIKEKIYENRNQDMDRVERKARNGFGMGLAGVLTGGAALLSQWGGRRGGLWGAGGGGAGMPENVNINTVGGGSYGGGQVAPTAFQAWEKGCEEALALTNAIWSLHVSSMQADYDHRQTDIAEKFGLYKSQTDADFALYKSQRDGFDALAAKQNQDAFNLYISQRNGDDAILSRVSNLEKEVAVGAAIRPYQDKLIQCEIEKAFTAGINYTDRKTCRMITGELVLPSTPTVTGFPSYAPCCNGNVTPQGV